MTNRNLLALFLITVFVLGLGALTVSAADGQSRPIKGDENLVQPDQGIIRNSSRSMTPGQTS